MNYNYERFWEIRGQTPAEPFDDTKQNLILDILKDIDYLTVLEFGCGNGELSQLIKKKNCHLTGVDISEDRLQMNTDIDGKVLTDITKDILLPVADLVICSHFLLHIKPDDLENVIKKMLKYSSKYVIFIEPNPKVDLGKWEYYNFQHDYDNLLNRMEIKYEVLYLSPFVNCWIIQK